MSLYLTSMVLVRVLMATFRILRILLPLVKMAKEIPSKLTYWLSWRFTWWTVGYTCIY